MSDLEKIKARYSELGTMELTRLARDYKDMREDVLPILFEELEKRGESGLVESIKQKMTAPETVTQKNQGFAINPIEESTYDKEIAENPEILDDETYERLFTHSQTEIMSLAYNKVLKHKATLSNWTAVQTMIHEKWDFSDRQFIELHHKLTKKKKRANAFLAFTIILTSICVLVMIASEGAFLASPGLLIIILAISSYSTNKHLGRILSSKDELDQPI